MRGTRRILEELVALRRDSTTQLAELRRESNTQLAETRRESAALMAEIRREEAVQHAETRALIEDLAERAEDDRRINREILRRNEIVMRQVADAVAEFKEESRQTREFSRTAAEATEAHTRAIFALIDRLGNGPTPASGAA